LPVDHPTPYLSLIDESALDYILVMEDVTTRAAEIIEDTRVPYIGSLSTSPQTFLHGDAHIGNTCLLPDDEVGFLDWQAVRRGNWSVDVGISYKEHFP
jgi:aminoglycoside phosphotransferase (APT) family kinase protein